MYTPPVCEDAHLRVLPHSTIAGKCYAYCNKTNSTKCLADCCVLDYCLLCTQVVDLLHVAGSGLGRQFIRVATSTITLMLHQYPELADKYVFKPLMAPLLKVTEHCKCL